MDWSHKPYYSDWDRVEIACPHCSEHIYINETQYENITTITEGYCHKCNKNFNLERAVETRIELDYDNPIDIGD